MPNLNVDKSPPVNFHGAFSPMQLTRLQNGNIPTFWEDNQVLSDEEPFRYSQSSGMTLNTPIHVPKVVRFIYAYDTEDAYADTGDPDDPGGGGGPPPPKVWTVAVITPISGEFLYRVTWVQGESALAPTVSYTINNFLALSSPPSSPLYGTYVPSSAYAGAEVELPYGESPNYSNDGVYAGYQLS